MNFKFLNNLVGWIVFAIAAATYLMTIEPTASFWDCGEFISTANKLEVGHPPGAPFFMLTARFFTLFASDQTQVAMMVNSFSALCSALCILFLFWTITHLGRRLVVARGEEVPMDKTWGILGAGAVGALAYTFSDTFWFSAVEGEVYAYSSLFTAVVFWAMLKWDDVADEPYANRWLVLIAYLMGLSIGVHLLNLLTIPAMALVYYFRKAKNPTWKGTLLSLVGSCVILAMVLYGIVPGFVEVAGWFELFFVNNLGFSFNMGTIVYAFLLIGCLVWGVWETSQKEEGDVWSVTRMNISFILSVSLLGIPFFGSHVFLGLLLIAALTFVLFRYRISVQFMNLVLLCCMVILIGYSSYAVVVIRSAANTPMDQNSPDDVFALKSYLNRDQYGDTPLLYGESYASEVKRTKTDRGWEADIKYGDNVYGKKIKTTEGERDQYVAYDQKKTYRYENCMFFPRMYSKQDHHVRAYKIWGGDKGRKVTYRHMDQRKTAVVPTFGENLRFFFSYQVNFMYWRYFMWNFVGRQNDIQGNGEITNGNWISGIPFIDNLLVGDQSTLPDELKNNKGRNTYYFLPLILGLMGMVYQFRRRGSDSSASGIKEPGIQSFCITAVLFFMTGLAIVLYLNQTPYQPRERDYAYAGSFYAFSIWIGLGVMELAHYMKRGLGEGISNIIATIACLFVPALMGTQNWDDHDRSGRFTARDFGQNYLLSLKPNAVIFTNGDNDTFPLWYNQEVEGVGTDARVANLSYLQMGWYVDQMKRQAYLSDPLPLSLRSDQYMNGNLDIAYVVDVFNRPLDVATALRVASHADESAKALTQRVLGNDGNDFLIPSRQLYIDVDSASAIASGTVAPEMADKLVDRLDLNLSGKTYVGKHEIMIMDLLQNNNWQRPIYYAVTVGNESNLGLRDYMQLEGMAYRIVPIKKNPMFSSEMVNTDVMYDNMRNKFKWGGIAENPNIYMDENNLRMTSTCRFMFVRLVSALMGEATRAEMEGDYCDVLAWVIEADHRAMQDEKSMNIFRSFSAEYFDNDRIAYKSVYSDSMLVAYARRTATDILGKREQGLGNSELARALKEHKASIDTVAKRRYAEERRAMALEMLDYAQQVLPSPQIPYNAASLMMAQDYLKLGQKDKAMVIMDAMQENALQYLNWIEGLSETNRRSAKNEYSEQFSIYHEILMSRQELDRESVSQEEMMQYEQYLRIYNSLR